MRGEARAGDTGRGATDLSRSYDAGTITRLVIPGSMVKIVFSKPGFTAPVPTVNSKGARPFPSDVSTRTEFGSPLKPPFLSS